MNENTDIGDVAVLTLPVVALRDIIVFPHMTVNLDIGRKESIEAVRAAGRSDRYLAMIMQRDGKVEVPQEEDLYSFGTVVKVKQMLQLTRRPHPHTGGRDFPHSCSQRPAKRKLLGVPGGGCAGNRAVGRASWGSIQKGPFEILL